LKGKLSRGILLTQSTEKTDVTVIGAAGIDTNVYLHSDNIDWSVEANFTQNIDYIGQAGGYYAMGFNNLGYSVKYIGSVGNDPYGNYIIQEFQKNGIDTSGVFIDPMGTKRSINLMYKDGQRKNFYDGKGHMSIMPDMERCRTIMSHSKLIHFNLMNWSRKLIPIAKELEIQISCDLQDVVDIEDPYRQDFIIAADVLLLSGVNHPDPSSLIESLRKRNQNALILVGLGSNGCALGTSDGLKFFNAVDIPDRPIIDTNGAGDTLGVGFLSSYFFEGSNLETSVLRGQYSARYTCSIKASTLSLISKNQLDSYALS
jgi:sugar/nucleoside kinase (ribokinase family)